MSQALAVEKTSKRGGRIIHEKDLMPPPMFGESFKTPQTMAGPDTPPWANPDPETQNEDLADPSSMSDPNGKPSITDLLKNPTKVVMCKVRSLPFIFGPCWNTMLFYFNFQ